MRYVVVAVAFLLFCSVVSAQGIDLAIVKISLDESGNAAVQQLFIIDSTSLDSFTVQLPDYSQNVKAFDASGLLETQQVGNELQITPRNSAPNYSITVEYTTPSLTSKDAEEWDFYFQPDFPFPPDDFSLELTLPGPAMLLQHSPQGIVYPQDSALKIEWGNNYESSFAATYTLDGAAPSPDDEDFSTIILTAAFVVLIVAAFGAAFFFLRKGRGKEKTAREKIMRMLSENEKQVLGEVEREDGITQKSLLAKTALPKATLSRTLKKLEQKQVVECREVGLTKKVFLTDSFKKR